MALVCAFRCYVSPAGVDEIRAWYEQQPKKVRGKFLSRLKTLGQLPMNSWQLPPFRWLHGECHPLGEVRFEVLKVQHRPLGFRVGERTFTLTIVAQEKSNRFVPRTACSDGLTRKAEIEGDRRRSHECWLKLE